MTSELSNTRGIPKATFISNVDEFMEANESSDAVLAKLQETLSKYKFMLSHLEQRQKALRNKVPEIKKSLEAVQLLATHEELETRFELSDTLYATAIVPPTQSVYLWLGASIMMEYPIAEGEALLSEKLTNADKNIAELDVDLGFLREQVTTMEVNMARVYNWTVKKRKGGGGASSSSSPSSH